VAETVRFELSERVHLRLPQPADTDELWALTVANQAHLARWMPWAVAPPPREQTAAWIAGAQRQVAENNGFQCVIVDDGRITGCVGFHRVDWPNGVTSLGYWLAEDAQGRGTMTAAVRALVGHAFGTWRLHRVMIAAAPENVRSRAIPERLGFTQEGVLREAELVAGRRLDHVVYGLLAREWQAGR
jgi:ribosomal-protein-serine acetyltransferase